MIDTGKLTSYGVAANAATCSILTITAWQSLFTVKTFVMAGKGLPPFTMGVLYRGYGANLTCDNSNQVVALVANKFFSETIMNSKPLSPLESCLGGMFSGAASGPILSFLERVMILTQLREENSSVKGFRITSQIVKNVWDKEGIRGFGRGIPITASRESINYGCFFGLKNILQRQAEKRIEDKKTASLVSYLGAGVLAGALTTPLDLIKTRMQKEVGGRVTFLNTVSQIVKEGSIAASGSLRISAIRNLFQGCIARSLVAGATMATFGPLTEALPAFFPGFLKEKTV